MDSGGVSMLLSAARVASGGASLLNCLVDVERNEMEVDLAILIPQEVIPSLATTMTTTTAGPPSPRKIKVTGQKRSNDRATDNYQQYSDDIDIELSSTSTSTDRMNTSNDHGEADDANDIVYVGKKIKHFHPDSNGDPAYNWEFVWQLDSPKAAYRETSSSSEDRRTSSSSSSSMELTNRVDFSIGEFRSRFVSDKRLHKTQFGETSLCVDQWNSSSNNKVVVKQNNLDLVQQKLTSSCDYPDRELAFLRLLSCSPSFNKYPQRKNVYQLAGVAKDSTMQLVATTYGGEDAFMYIVPGDYSRPMSEVVAKQFFFQIADTMRILHSLGLAHNDLSLENLCRDQNGAATIIDFGASSIRPFSILEQEANQSEESRKWLNDIRSIPEHELELLYQNHNMSEYLVYKKSPESKIPGKTQYRSYEMVNNRTFDLFKNDVWCFGVALHMAVSLCDPFNNKNKKNSSATGFHSSSFNRVYNGNWNDYYNNRLKALLHEYQFNNNTAAIQSLYHEYPFAKFSPELRQLLDAIFKPERLRPSFEQLLKLPWFQNINHVNTNTAISPMSTTFSQK